MMTDDEGSHGSGDGEADRTMTGDPATGVPVDPVDAAELERAAAVLDRASAGLSASTDRDPSPGLVPAVMQTVRAELRPGQEISLPGSDGTLLVTETAVGNALVVHLDGLPELLVRRCRVRHRADTSTDGSLDVSVTAAIAYGTHTGELVDRIRSVMKAGAEELFGLDVGRVDVEFVDVFPAVGSQR
jgi:hypothetical protein